MQAELLDEKLLQFDLAKLGAALKADRDLQFDYLGLQTLFDRYFLHVDEVRIELPQAFFMRVAMGLALGEIDREARAIEFYEVLSTFDFMSRRRRCSTRHAALAAVELLPDHRVRRPRRHLRGAQGERCCPSSPAAWATTGPTCARWAATSRAPTAKSQGRGAVPEGGQRHRGGVNQGGKRKGAVCAYLESWHLDLEEFLELRKNTGDDRRRTTT